MGLRPLPQTTKRPASHCCAVALISSPDGKRWFFQRKDPGLPNIYGFDKTLCPMGGNWWEDGANDLSPVGTLVRELKEELCFPNGEGGWSRDERLQWVLYGILGALTPYRAALVTSSKKVFDLRPGNTKGDSTALSFYFRATLDAKTWGVLEDLQAEHGRLSNEGGSAIMSLEDMIRKERFAYAHDQMVQRLLLEMGYSEAKGMTLYENPPIEEVSWMGDYAEVEKYFDLARTPFYKC